MRTKPTNSLKKELKIDEKSIQKMKNDEVFRQIILLRQEFEVLKQIKTKFAWKSISEKNDYLKKLKLVLNEINHLRKQLKGRWSYKVNFSIYALNKMEKEFKDIKKLITKTDNLCVVCANILEYPQIFPKNYPKDKKICCLCRDSWLYHFNKNYKSQIRYYTDDRLENHYIEYEERLRSKFIIH